MKENNIKSRKNNVSKAHKKEGWHYELAEKVVNDLPDWKKEIYQENYSINNVKGDMSSDNIVLRLERKKAK